MYKAYCDEAKAVFLCLMQKKKSQIRLNLRLLAEMVDILPRAKQQPTGLIAAPAAQGRAVRLLIAGTTQTRTPPPQRGRGVLFLVEAMGVEPMSEKSSA